MSRPERYQDLNLGYMVYTFRIQLARDGTWSWGIFREDSTRGFGAGEATKIEAVGAIKAWLRDALGWAAENECECGARKIYKAFAPGHGHWCPVSEHAIVEVKL